MYICTYTYTYITVAPGLKVKVSGVGGALSGSTTVILLDSICSWHHWFPQDSHTQGNHQEGAENADAIHPRPLNPGQPNFARCYRA